MEQKKILLIASQFPPSWGGVATYSYEIAKGFSEKGHQVTILTGQPEATEDLGFEVIRTKLGKTGLSSIPFLTMKLVHLLRTRQFDHVFCTLWLPGGLSYWLAKKSIKQAPPYSLSVHAMEIVESSETIKKRLRQKLIPLKKACFQQAKKIFCVSHFSKKLLETMITFNEQQVVVINNGANPKYFFPTTEFSSSPYPRLFTACRLMPNKGIDQVIKALPDLITDFPELQYRIAGEGPDLERLQKLTDMMQVKSHVQFIGKISQDQLVEEYQRADLFVMLSRKEKHFVEGFGLVFLEAALCGTASLGGHSGGIPDAIDEGQTGWLVDPYSEGAIAKKLKSILADQGTLARVSHQAQQTTLNSKTWVHRMEQFCQELGF